MRDKYLTVSALTKYIKRKIEIDPHLRNVWLRGEISNFKHHSRGHMYMTIKDDQSKIQAVMFAGNNRHLKFIPENGMNVLIKGEVNIYEAFGQYQLYIQHMQPDGIGALYLSFEQLKEKLRKKGYFDPKYKKEIPLFPKHIGIITSPTGAAVRDIITTIKRRYPIVRLTIIPVLVQGENAATSISQAIVQANEIADFDTLIVGRGGGSIEELWSFNEEIVAEAIFQSKTPIISAVGHETDMTISDYVADLRAPTPTGAAELAVPSQLELNEKISKWTNSLQKEINRKLEESEEQLKRLTDAYAFRFPLQLMKEKEQELDQQIEQLERAFQYSFKNWLHQYETLQKRLFLRHPETKLEQAQTKLEENINRLNKTVVLLTENKRKDLTNMINHLILLNPLEIMKRGFALPYKDDGSIIKTIHEVERKEHIHVQVADGNISCEVIEVEEKINE